MNETPSRSGEKRWVRVGVAFAAVVIAGLAVWRERHYVHDDAFITLRYVERWLGGHGLTWNDGERVEGFTHPLWLLQITALGALGMPLENAARFLGVGYFAAGLFLLARSRIWPLALLLVATQPGIALWSVSGLETVSFAFWIGIGVGGIDRACAPDRHDSTRHAMLAGLAWAAAALTRPEATGVGLLGLVWMAAARPHAQRESLRSFALAFVGPLLAYLVFRVAYFNDLLPNAAWAKATGLPMARRVQGTLDYLAQNLPFWLPSTLLAVVIIVAARSRRWLWPVVATIPLWGVIVAGAGDHMVAGRLLLPIAVVFSLAVGWAYGSLSAPARGWATALAVVVAGVQALAEFRQPADQDTAAAVGGPIGQFLERTLEHGSLVATATAGSTPYYARSIRFIDTLGLNDRHIAHRDVDSVVTRMQRYPGHLKGDGAYVLGRRPDVVILGPAEGYLGRPPKAWFLTDYELLSSAEFRSMYRPFRFAIPITTAEAGHPRVRELSDPSHEHLRFIAYLRLDSPRALGLAYHGQLLAAPWESSTSIPNASRD